MQKQQQKPQHIAYKKGLLLEQAAAIYLQKQGLVIIQHNFHCQFGEIDLIGKHKDDLVFVEVRYRKNLDYGTPGETINFTKKKSCY